MGVNLQHRGKERRVRQFLERGCFPEAGFFQGSEWILCRCKKFLQVIILEVSLRNRAHRGWSA